MDDEAAWESLIADIYLSATDLAARARVPAALARAVGGASAALWMVDPRTGNPASDVLTNLPREGAALYSQHYHRLDPWMAHNSRMAWNEVTHGSELIPDAELARSEYYNDFGRHMETFHVVGTRLMLGTDPTAAFGALAVLRPKDKEAFAAAEAARLQRLLPHLRRAWQVSMQLASPGGPAASLNWDLGVAAVLAGIRTAAVVTDGYGRVRLTNPAAERLDTAGALILRGAPPDRVLRLEREEDTQRLLVAIADAARGGPGLECLLPLGAAGPCRITVSPLLQKLPGCVGWTLVLITPEALASDEATLQRAQRLFGFTRTEAEVALALATGQSPGEIAEARGVRISTIRSQLVSAQDKAGASDLRALAIRLTLLRD
ncbi:helix-turn-helix transcriptional regulator [Roseomonas populi]|uniref:Helix-turn-helix transcriptional regulator n=1 Tax=Roseomonas populi TaxID=3121582 RepID=A0ABT1X9D7_9PROT|nr:helix-turn-helix transcriptional regulator [Roseomonas pecuniae]MCR0984719.1 helix-turn-helix transcriptional regulator [Roseomonas pecuniae]